jgi:hypothetical protein
MIRRFETTKAKPIASKGATDPAYANDFSVQV